MCTNALYFTILMHVSTLYFTLLCAWIMETRFPLQRLYMRGYTYYTYEYNIFHYYMNTNTMYSAMLRSKTDVFC